MAFTRIFSAFVFSMATLFSWGQCAVPDVVSSAYTKYLSCGDQNIDNLFKEEIVDIGLVYGVKVNFNFYEDNSLPNAKCQCHTSSTYDASIIFGVSLLNKELWNSEHGENALIGILAHEMGHALQCKEGYSAEGKERELQADFLAGYYMGRKKNFYTVDIKKFATALYTMGDKEFWSADPHGSPTERVNAMYEGYKYAYLSIDKAFKKGCEYVKQVATNVTIVYKETTPTLIFNDNSNKPSSVPTSGAIVITEGGYYSGNYTNVTVTGSKNVTVVGTISGQLTLMGSGDVTAKCSHVNNILCQGSGDLTIECNVSGSVQSMGSGDIQINGKVIGWIEVLGSGDITVAGKVQGQISILGSGEVYTW